LPDKSLGFIRPAINGDSKRLFFDFIRPIQKSLPNLDGEIIGSVIVERKSSLFGHLTPKVLKGIQLLVQLLYVESIARDVRVLAWEKNAAGPGNL